MAQENYLAAEVFRLALDGLSRLSPGLGEPESGATLLTVDLEQRLQDAEVVPPLHYAIQVALCRSRANLGIRPAARPGHSPGEMAVAVVIGRILDDVGMGIAVARARFFAPLRGKKARWRPLRPGEVRSTP